MYSAGRTRQWDTARAGCATPLAYWSAAMAEALLPVEVSSPVGDAFGGRMLRLDLGKLALVQAQAGPFEAHQAASQPGGPLLLMCQAGVPWDLRLGGQLLHLRPGDMVLAGAGRPFHATFAQGCQLLTLVLPRASAARWLRDPDAALGHVAWREQAWGRTLSALCLQLAEDPLSALALPLGRLDAMLGSLLAASFEAGAQAVPRRGRGLVDRAHELMERELDQCGLTVADLARRLNVSVRSLHRAFALQDRKVAAELRTLRMQRAAQLLADARLRALPIAEIGSRCGYGDASHFTREFRRAWLQTPAQWRAQAAEADAPVSAPAGVATAAFYGRRGQPAAGHNPAP